MNREKNEDLDDFFDDGEEIDEEEYATTSSRSRPINWRKIEMVKEQRWLKQQLEDFQDWAE